MWFVCILLIAVLSGLVLGFVLPLIAIVDILRSRFQGNDALLFVLLVLFIPLGAVLYFILAPSHKVSNSF